MKLTKSELRRQILIKRNQRSSQWIKNTSRIIQEKLASTSEYIAAMVICIYVSFGSEVETHRLIIEALKSKKVCVPIVQDGMLKFGMIHDINDLDHMNKYGILEPSKLELADKIDLMIIPGIAFDITGNRIEINCKGMPSRLYLIKLKGAKNYHGRVIIE